MFLITFTWIACSAIKWQINQVLGTQPPCYVILQANRGLRGHRDTSVWLTGALPKLAQRATSESFRWGVIKISKPKVIFFLFSNFYLQNGKTGYFKYCLQILVELTTQLYLNSRRMCFHSVPDCPIISMIQSEFMLRVPSKRLLGSMNKMNHLKILKSQRAL